jgi:hypothetical protein
MHHERGITGGTKEVQNGSGIRPDNDTFVPYFPHFAGNRGDIEGDYLLALDQRSMAGCSRAAASNPPLSPKTLVDKSKGRGIIS